MRKLLLLTTLFLSGCGVFQIHEYDAETVQQIDATIRYEKTDGRLSEDALIEAGATPEVIEALRLRNRSELLRLEAWRLYEESKKRTDG